MKVSIINNFKLHQKFRDMQYVECWFIKHIWLFQFYTVNSPDIQFYELHYVLVIIVEVCDVPSVALFPLLYFRWTTSV